MALGRKNWIHVGSPQAGAKVAAILSIVESCRRLQMPIRDYLTDVLPGLAYWSIQHLKDRTPAAWAACRQYPARPLRVNPVFTLTLTVLTPGKIFPSP